MPRGQITKDLIKYEVLKIKAELDKDNSMWGADSKGIAHRYLNKILDKLEEYRY
jgi:hypothetical protein